MTDEYATGGRWNDDVTPKRGWFLLEVIDLEDDYVICQMCGHARVRFVHVMEHKTFPELLQAGCVCAGHMMGDMDAAQDAEKEARNRAARRRMFLDRDWRVSYRGNVWLPMGDYVVGVQELDCGYRGFIKRKFEDKPVFGKKVYRTMDEAKLALFDAVHKFGERDGLEVKGRQS